MGQVGDNIAKHEGLVPMGDTVNVSPYTHSRDLPLSARQRDFRCIAAQFRWLLNLHCPNGVGKEELLEKVGELEEGACKLTEEKVGEGTWGMGKVAK